MEQCFFTPIPWYKLICEWIGTNFAFSWFYKSICVIDSGNSDNKSVEVGVFEFHDNIIITRVHWFFKKSFWTNTFYSSFVVLLDSIKLFDF